MRVPMVERRESGAAPWGGAAVGDARLTTTDAPLAPTVIKGTLLTIVTLGIYRFWYRTRLRRYYWTNTLLLDDGFEYAGTGKELFIGFLIALAVIIPLNIALSVAGVYLAQDSLTGIVLTIATFLVIPALVQFALFRARRYRLSRTRYRGIRFAQTGSAVEYLIISAKWLLLTILTLGIVFPYFRTALQRYRIDNSWFGTQQASFDAKAGPLMKPWLLVMGAFVMVMVMIVVAIFSQFSGPSVAAFVVEGMLAFGFMLAVPFLWLNYKAKEFRHFTGATRFGEIGLSSDIRAGSIIGVYLRFGLISLGVLIVYGLLVGAGVFSRLSGMDFDFEHPPAFGSMAISFLATIALVIGWGILAELYLRRPIWQRFAQSITVHNVAGLAAILQSSGTDATAFGEAFDTGFDIAG